MRVLAVGGFVAGGDLNFNVLLYPSLFLSQLFLVPFGSLIVMGI